MKQQNQTFRFQINEKLNESNAQAILHKFIQSFLQELNIESHNFFYSTELETDDYTASEPPKFLYIFTVPENDYFNCIVQGKPYTNKTQAKQSCCYNACEWLYKHGIIEKMLKETNSDVNLLQSHLNDFNLNNDANKDNTDSPVSETNTAQQINEVRKKSTQSKWFTHIQNRREAHSNKHYLYVFTFQSDYDFFVGNKHQHLGLITTEPFPNPIIDSMIYRNEQLIKFTIKNVFCEPINDHQKKLIKLFHYHIMEHFIPKLFNSKEKNDYLSSYLNFPDLTLYFVLVNLHNATTFSIDFDLFEELRTWTHQINQYHKTRSQPLQNGYTDEQVSEQFPPQTLILPFHQKKFTLHIVSQKEQSTKVYPKKKFMHCPKKEKSRDDRKSGKKTPSENSLIEIDYIEYYREKYGISLEHTTVQLVSALRLSQLLQRNLQYSVSHKSSKAVYEEFKGGGGGGGSEKIHHQYYPPELVSVYPLTVHAVSLISAILPIVHRLEQFHLANDLLEEVFGGSQQHTLRLNNEPSCESLITEALFGNMKMTKCNDKTNLAVSRTTKIKTESVETDQSNQQTLDSANQPELHFGDSLMLMFAGDITEHIDITFDTFDEFLCPSPWVVVKALTLISASDVWNLEQLETIGDAFLKMNTVLHLYFKYPIYDEGKLSDLKVKIICNENLSQKAKAKCLKNYLFATQFNREHNWFKGILVPNDWMNDNCIEQLKTANSDNLADTVEALIGAFIFYGSAGATSKLFQWFDLPFFQPSSFPSFNLENTLKSVSNLNDATFNQFFQEVSNSVSVLYETEMFSKVETNIEYCFKEKYLLVQAFTHSCAEYSSELKKSIRTYQRLEYIGDGILDYLFTHFMYHKDPTLSSQNITLTRCALVNNDFYASISVKYNLHQHIQTNSYQLLSNVESFAQYSKNFKTEQHLKEKLSKNKNSKNAQEKNNKIVAPKVLADIFEALVGAIYIDCGCKLDVVWQVVYKMVKVEFDYFLEHIPINPLSWLETNFYNCYNFSVLKNIEANTKKICLTLNDNGVKKEFLGFGSNQKQCKMLAAKQAMIALNTNYV